MSLVDDDYYQRNRKLIADYLRSGSKGPKDGAHGMLGFELEHVVLRALPDGSSAPAEYEGSHGVAELLRRLRPHYDAPLLEGDRLVGLACPGETVTTEPSLQTEVSAGPHGSVTELAGEYRRWRSWVDPIVDELGLSLPELGYNPTAPTAELPLSPKFRYACMDRYLRAIGGYGPQMMRGSASLQISIDFSDERDAARKLRIANAIGPVMALMLDNAPIHEGGPRRYNLVRTRIWQDVDPARCGVVPGSLGQGFSFERYADWVLGVPAILVPDESSPGGWRYVGAQTFAAVYRDREMTRAEVEHALSMEWPDVRVKTYLEIRQADAVPAPYAFAYAALVKGLFYGEASLSVLEGELSQAGSEGGFVSAWDVTAAKDALILDEEGGYGARVYGRPVGAWADLLLRLAHQELDTDEERYLDPLDELVSSRETLAQRWLRVHDL